MLPVPGAWSVTVDAIIQETLVCEHTAPRDKAEALFTRFSNWFAALLATGGSGIGHTLGTNDGNEIVYVQKHGVEGVEGMSTTGGTIVMDA